MCEDNTYDSKVTYEVTIEKIWEDSLFKEIGFVFYDGTKAVRYASDLPIEDREYIRVGAIILIEIHFLWGIAPDHTGRVHFIEKLRIKRDAT